jgi:hypothetical protein
LAKRFTELFHSNHFIDRGSDRGEVKPVHRADVAVQHFADVQSDINIGNRQACRFTFQVTNFKLADASTAASRARRQAAFSSRSSNEIVASIASPINLST